MTVASDDPAHLQPGLRPGLSAEAALGLILADCCQDIDMHLAAFLESDDESGAHKTRVALRRLTTALDAFAPLLKGKARKAQRDEAKGIFRELGKVRDADVYLAGLPADDRSTKIVAQTDRLRQKTRGKLRKKKAVGFSARLLRQFRGDDLLREKPAGRDARAEPIEGFAADALTAIWQECLAHGPKVSRLDAEQRHEFRKEMKTLRYLAEFFAPLWPDTDQPETQWPEFRQKLQDLQDDLGLLNDLANARKRSPGKKAKPVVTPEEEQALARADALWAAFSTQPMWWQAAPPADHNA